MARVVAATLTTGWPSYVAVPTARAKWGIAGAPGTGRRIPIISVRSRASAPVKISSTPSSPRAAVTSIEPMRACGYGQRPTAIWTACAGSMSSAKRPAPRSSLSSSFRSWSVPRTP